MKSIVFFVLICYVYIFYISIQPFAYGQEPKLDFHSEPCFPKQNIDNNSAIRDESRVDKQEWISIDE